MHVSASFRIAIESVNGRRIISIEDIDKNSSKKVLICQ